MEIPKKINFSTDNGKIERNIAQYLPIEKCSECLHGVVKLLVDSFQSMVRFVKNFCKIS